MVADTTRAIAVTIGLLTLSNVFMTFAWYGHLKELYHPGIWR